MSAPVVVIGGGPAGLSAAAELRRHGLDVVVLEREDDAGGVPRHTDHLGFGIGDFHRVLSGPTYARRLVERAVRAGVDVRTGVTVASISNGTVAMTTGSSIEASAIVVATGVRERPRSARLVPGDRPAGVFTTGALQQFVQRGLFVGERAVVVGAEHVSFSAIATLAHAGSRTVAMITPLARHQSYAPLRWLTATRHRVPVLTGVEVVRVVGHGRVESVELSDGQMIECDTVVFTGDWVTDHELIRGAGARLLPGGRAAIVDGRSRTEVPGVFAVGNLVHPAETAGRCAAGGTAVAAAVVAHVRGAAWPAVSAIEAQWPVQWAAPMAGGVTVRVGEAGRGRVVVRNAGAVVMRSRSMRLLPNKPIHLRGALPNGPSEVVVESRTPGEQPRSLA